MCYYNQEISICKCEILNIFSSSFQKSTPEGCPCGVLFNVLIVLRVSQLLQAEVVFPIQIPE